MSAVREAVQPITSGSALEAPAEFAVNDPRLKLYKSVEGYHAITDWYDSVVAKMDFPYESMYFNTDFGRTHVLAAGDPNAPALFLIPGVAGCAPLWRKQLEAFAPNFRVYALDIPGQPGRSEPRPLSFLNDDYAKWLVSLMDSMELEKASFAGVSVGGWIAMRMGVYAPERVNKLILMGPTGLSRAKLPVKIWVTKALNKRKDANALQDDLTAKSVSNPSPGASFGTFDRDLARCMALCTKHYRVDHSVGIYDEENGRIDRWKGLKVLRRFFLAEPRSLIRQCSPDTLLIFGEYEMLYRPHKVGKKAQKLMPSVEVEVVENAGHAAVYDKPEETTRLITEFMQR